MLADFPHFTTSCCPLSNATQMYNAVYLLLNGTFKSYIEYLHLLDFYIYFYKGLAVKILLPIYLCTFQ